MRLIAILLCLSVLLPEAAAQPARGKVGDYRSRNYLMHTDLPEKDAKELLTKLEKMLAIISKYWGRPNRQTIEIWVVKDLRAWPAGSLDPKAIPSLQGRAGITFRTTQARGGRLFTKSRAFAYYTHGTPLHEAVHAYCGQAFGTTGPTWYAEGMAEMGSYWNPKDPAVNVPRHIVKYLTNAKPKSLNAIVNGQERTGDSWQNYAWRWALCHLLANNTNYAKQFRPLGLGLLAKKRGYTFERIYGPMAEEIVFEYKFFLKHVENGYRADLCSWNWKAKFRRPTSTRAHPTKIKANAGWQPTKMLVRKDEVFSVTTEGTWTLVEKGKPLTAKGDANGAGKLVGVVMSKDYTLSEPFDIGDAGKFTIPADGKLYIRCRDSWGSLADNAGSMTVKFKRE